MTKAFLYVVMVPLVALTLLACDKPVSNEDDLGPQSSPSEIQRAQAEAVNGVRPEKILVGETAHFAETQELITSEGPVTRLLREWTVEVIEKEVLEQSLVDQELLEFTTIRSLIDHNQVGKPVSKFKDLFVFLGLPNEAKEDVESARLSLKLMGADSPAKVEKQIVITDVSFHNLSSETVKIKPPELVEQRPGCGGIANCELEGRKITYDVVFRFSDGEIQKHQIEWLISHQVPFFSSILKQCATTLVKVDTLRVLVKQCQDAVDFSFSPDDTPET